MKDKIREIYAKIQVAYKTVKTFIIKVKVYIEEVDREDFYSAVAYAPFIGWLFPLYIMKDSPRCQENAKQGLFL